MRRHTPISTFVAGALLLTAAPKALCAESMGFALQNGDTNGDLDRDLSDGVYLLSHLFLGGPGPVPLAYCAGAAPAVRNGDTNGDGSLDLSDGVHLLNWLAAGGLAPEPACPGGSGAGRNPNPRVIPPHALAHGKTYGDWGAEWWKWTLRMPAEGHPILADDCEGEDCHCDAGQSGPLWFLTGTFGGTAMRTCTVPAGKTLFFPLLNWVLWGPEDTALVDCIYPPADPENPEADLVERFYQTTNLLVDGTNALHCTVDGVEIESLFDYRAESSEAFSVFLSDLFGCDPEADDLQCMREPSVSEGHWLMLAPLSRGEHMIQYTSGALYTDPCILAYFGIDPEDPEAPDEFGFEVAVTYYLTVE
jgi:hypothetical protein